MVTGNLTIRGVTRAVPLGVKYLGTWPTPWWVEEDGEWVNQGPRSRAGFLAETEIDRRDFGITWNDTMDRGGVVVGNTVHITIDVEAILDDD